MTEYPSKSTGRDLAETTALAALNAVPIVGGSISVFVAEALQYGYKQRQTQWLNHLAEDVAALASQVDGLSVESIVSDDVFLDTVTRATRAAIGTHQSEKLDALRAAVLHSVLPNSPDQDQQTIYLSYVEDLTPSHLRLLALLNDPPTYIEQMGMSWGDPMMGGHSNTVERAFPDWAREFYDQLARDLHTRGLIGTNSLHGTISGNGLRQSQTTVSGKAFLAYITSPLASEARTEPDQ